MASTKSQILKDIARFTSSTIIAQAFTLIAGFWVAKFLGPTEFGVWTAVSLVLAYGAYMELGAISVMGRDLPHLLGKGDKEKINSLEGHARYITIIGAFLGALFVLIFSFSSSHSPIMAAGLQAMAIVLLFQQTHTYQRTTLRCYNKFKELSHQQLILSFTTSLLAITLVFFASFYGRILTAIIAQIGIVVYCFRRNPWRDLHKFNFSIAWSIIRKGIPIIISGFILSLLATIDRLFIIEFFGAEQLGFFSISILLVTVVSLIPTMAGQVLYSRIDFHYGNSDKNIESLKSFIIIPPKIFSALLPILIGILYFSIPLIIKTFMPEYLPGIKTARIVIIGIFFFGILGLTDYFLVTTGKLKQYISFGFTALVLKIILNYTFITLGYGIEGIAIGGTLLTYFIYSIIVIGYAVSHYIKEIKYFLRFFLRLWLPFIYMLILLWIIEVVVNYVMVLTLSNSLLFVTITQIFLYLICCFPLIFMVFRDLKIDFSSEGIKRYLQQ